MFVFVVFLIVNCLFGFVINAPPSEHNTRSFKNALSQQSLQTILQSIEERLRNLDQIYAIRYPARSDLNSDQYSRKLDVLETKLTRMETLFETYLEKISEDISSKNLKDDITKDQIFRKIDSTYERLNHKLSYLEGKQDMDNLKLQSKIEACLTKMDRLDHSISVRQSDMEAEISEGVEQMLNVKNTITTIETKIINVTKHAIENVYEKQVKLLNSNLNNITVAILNIEKTINNNNQSNITNDAPLLKTVKNYEDKITNYGNQVTNMYNELKEKSITIENSIKNSVHVTNLTREEIQDNINNLLKQFEHKNNYNENQNDGTLEIIVDSFTSTLQRKFTELSRKLETNFQNVLLAQNLFLESCHRIQMDESQLENKISFVLEKLLDSFTNRSISTFNEIQNIEEMIKSHDAHVFRSLNQNTNTVIKLSEKTSEDRKKIEKTLSAIKREIEKSLTTIRDILISENEEYNQKLDSIGTILQELQEQVNDLDSRMNEDNMNYNAKQTLKQILLQMKTLFNKNTFLQQLNQTIVEQTKTFVSVENLIKNIHHVLNNIDKQLIYFVNRNNQSVVQISNLKNYTLSNQTNNEHITLQENILENNDTIDVIFRIFPDNNLIKNETDDKYLSRFNYTIVNNKIIMNTNYFFNNNTDKTKILSNISTENIFEDVPMETTTIITPNDSSNLSVNKSETKENLTDSLKKDDNERKENINLIGILNQNENLEFAKQRDSSEHADIKNTTDETNLDAVSDLPDINEYDEDYEE